MNTVEAQVTDRTIFVTFLAKGCQFWIYTDSFKFFRNIMTTKTDLQRLYVASYSW